MNKKLEINTPRITVLMPVYNGGKYIRDAIESILIQTFSDFEFLIINDGSNDNTLEVIKSFTDHRIRLVNHQNNIGLIASLNEGIKLSQGEFIARMDHDDISSPARFQKEIDFLIKNTHVAMVASHIALINENGEEAGYWGDDIGTKYYREIFVTLADRNCIAHSSIMIRKSIALKYLYNTEQKGSEDWDLWMRLTADGLQIEKINETLLKYRVHDSSATSIQNAVINWHLKIIRVKLKFLKFQFIHFKINKYFFRVLYSLIRSVKRYILN